MNLAEEHAYQLVGQLVAATNGWDELKVAHWTTELVKLEDGDSAAKAMRQLTSTWDQPGAPPWGRFMTGYQALALRPGNYRALPPAGPVIGLDEHLRTLAGRTSIEAQRELEQWRRVLTTPAKDDGEPVALSSAWAKAFPTTDAAALGGRRKGAAS